MAESVFCQKFNNFCYICGKFSVVCSKRTIKEKSYEEWYQCYFGLEVIHDVDWAPSIICTTCISNLKSWIDGKAKCLPFGVPMIWTNPLIHDSDECYACQNLPFGMNRRRAKHYTYKETKFAQLPLPHDVHAIPYPRRPSPLGEDFASALETMESSNISVYQPSYQTAECNHVEFSQNHLDRLMRRLKLSQRQSIILAQELKKKNILAPDVRVYASINRHSCFKTFFKSIEDNSLAYCTDIRGLLSIMHQAYNPEDWRLFIDSSKSSLKAVLLHKMNTKNSVPLALSTQTKESYSSLKKIMDLLNYDDHMWKICADLKVIAILRGMQLGYTKNMCFICLWNTRFDGDQYNERNWPARQEVRLRQHNVVELPLVPIDKILLPPLHIKLGIVKNFIKALDSEGNAYNVLKTIFPRLSGIKIKEGILNGPDIRRLMKNTQFENALNDRELEAWNCVKVVIENVLGINRSENWRIYVDDMLNAFHRLQVRMSLKIHFLHHHAESDEHGERFHQITARLEHWYSGKKLDSLLGDICWNLQEDTEN